jgi:hypothetical protein
MEGTVPTPVQELAAAVVEPPNRYVVREQDRASSLLAAADMPGPIPVIDLSRLSDPAKADKLQAALQSWPGARPGGLSCFSFFRFVSLSIMNCLLHHPDANPTGYQPRNRSTSDGWCDASREFFRQSLEAKQKHKGVFLPWL